MRKVVLFVCVICCVAEPLLAQKGSNGKAVKKEKIISPLDIGSEIPLANLELDPAVASDSTKRLTLARIKTANGLVVIFSSNTCPDVQKLEFRMKEIMNFAKLKNVGLVIVNSEEGARKQGGESEPDMVNYAIRNAYTAPYIIDQASRLADFFGAKYTPEAYLFNGEGKLVYKGALVDNTQEPEKTIHFHLKEAVDVMLAKGKYIPDTTAATGCDIKRK